MKNVIEPGRVAWIVGASSGIGLAVAQRLAAKGMKVVISARSADRLAAAAATHDNLYAEPFDITDERAVGAVIERIETTFGPIDLAMFSAAVWHLLDVEDLDADLINRGMSVNFNGTVSVLVPVLKRMMARKRGHVAIVASVAGYRGLPRSSAYAPTKAALISLAECLAPDLHRHNIGVSIINPGFVATPMTAKNDFPMPFLMQVDDAATRIVRGLERGRYEIAFPWQLVTILKTLRLMPNGLFLWLIRRNVARPPKSAVQIGDQSQKAG
ncbi:MAG: SDR family NAD(P)-dependent oxidoreductase [Hyphomicrobiaceae bacterium]